MIDRDLIVDMRQMLAAQRAILHEADTIVSKLERSFSDTERQAIDISNLEMLMSEIEQNVSLLEFHDLEGLEQDDETITALYREHEDAAIPQLDPVCPRHSSLLSCQWQRDHTAMGGNAHGGRCCANQGRKLRRAISVGQMGLHSCGISRCSRISNRYFPSNYTKDDDFRCLQGATG